MKRRRRLLLTVGTILALILLVGYGVLRRQGLLLLPNEAPPARWEVWGVDVSSYQGEVDWGELRRQGVEFAFIKATEGSGSVDPCFAANWENAQAAGVLRGAYHFFSYDSPGETQAENFIAQVPMTAGALPPVVDIEFYGDKAKAPPDREEVEDILEPLLERLERHYGQKPILYATYRTYRLYLQGGFEDYPLWMTRPMFAPVDQDWDFWQFSHSARLNGYQGVEERIDLNVFRGSREELEEMGAAEVPGYPDPITGFFRTLECEWSETTLVTNVLAGMEAEAWKNEVESIFAFLGANVWPGLAEHELLDLEQMKRDLYTYVETQAELDAYMQFTDALESRDTITICRGTGFPSGQYWAEGEHERAFVTDMYDIFAFDHGADTPEDHYVFDPQAVLAQLETDGLNCALGRYAIEKTREEIRENPIDLWTDKYLYQDGTTLAMAEDAWMEQEIWKVELEHAYQLLLEQANPAAGLEDKVETAKNALLAFGPAYGRCTSYYQYSGAFVREWWEKEPQDYIVTGTMARYAGPSDTARYYRRETLALRERLESQLGDELTWAFEPEPYMTRLEDRYQSIYGEEYAERFWPEEVKL